MGVKDLWDGDGLFVPMPLVGKAGVKALFVAAPSGTVAIGAVAHAIYVTLIGLIVFTLVVVVGAVWWIRRECSAVPLRPSRQHRVAPGEAAAIVRAQAVPAGDVHYHTHFEEHYEPHYEPHYDNHLHVQAPAAPQEAVEGSFWSRSVIRPGKQAPAEVPAIAPRATVPGLVLESRDEARLRP